MVKRIKLGLVRDVSIEGMVSNFKKTCNGDGCWQRAFGLIIQRAVFVHAGADPLAKIERIFESLERDMKNMKTITKQDDAPDATAAAESTPVAEVTQAAPEKVKDETKINLALRCIIHDRTNYTGLQQLHGTTRTFPSHCRT